MFRPQAAFIVTTAQCNRRGECLHCFYNVQPDRNVETRLTPEALNGLLTRLRLAGIRGIYLSGGEPLLVEGLPDTVLRARSMGFDVMLLSNGLLLTSELVERFDGKLASFILSLPSNAVIDPRIASRVVGFRRTALSVICVVTRKNYTRAADVWNEVTALGARVLFQPPFIPEDHPLEPELGLRRLNPFDWSYLYAALRPWAKTSGYETYWKFVYDFYHERAMKLPRCYFAGNAMVIDADGAVYPCFHRRDLPCGNVLDDDISVILNRAGEHVRGLLDGGCFGEHCISLQTAIGRE